MDSRIEVEIFGEKIFLLSSEDDNYIKEIASYVDKKMLEVFKLRKARSSKPFIDSMLLGVNIADDLFKRIKEAEKAKDSSVMNQKKEPVKEEKQAISNEKNIFLEKQINDLKNQLKAEKDNNFMLKKQIEKLKVDLDNKTKETEAIQKEFDEFIESFGDGK